MVLARIAGKSSAPGLEAIIGSGLCIVRIRRPHVIAAAFDVFLQRLHSAKIRMRRRVANACSVFNLGHHRSALSPDGGTPSAPRRIVVSRLGCGEAAVLLLQLGPQIIRRLQQGVSSLFGFGDPKGLQIGVSLGNQVAVRVITPIPLLIPSRTVIDPSNAKLSTLLLSA